MSQKETLIYQYSSYTDYLKALLLERQMANPAYSLRAMALNLGLSASTLSDVLKGKKKFSEKKAHEVAQKLKLSSRKIKYFVTLVLFAGAQGEEMKQLLLGQLRALNPSLREHIDVDLDRFRFIADWHHWVILEMTYLHKQKMDVVSIADSLEITVEQAQDSLDLLTKFELIEKVDEYQYKKTHQQFKFQSENANLAIRKFHHQMLGKAQASLHTQTSKEKLIGSETVPMNVDDLPEANDIIESCFQRVLELSKRSTNRSHVYHLGIQFFQVSKKSGDGLLKKENS